MGYIWDEEKTRQENGQNSILAHCHVTWCTVRMRKVTANASETRQERTKQHFGALPRDMVHSAHAQGHS
jgi:hypothetical protein